MDQLHRQMFMPMLSPDWSHSVEAAIDVTLIGRYYERFADHAVSVARRIVYRSPASAPRRWSRTNYPSRAPRTRAARRVHSLHGLTPRSPTRCALFLQAAQGLSGALVTLLQPRARPISVTNASLTTIAGSYPPFSAGEGAEIGG